MTMHRAGRYFCSMAFFAAVWVLGSCAQPGAPHGGPPDITPPTVDLTIPGSADVGVARDFGLVLQFSEPMEKTTLESGIAVSPGRAGTPKFEWSSGSRRVHISWPDSLRDSTTYRITLTNRVADRRGNKLAEPYTFAFSTGAHVDRGEIRGHVRFDGSKAGAYDVFAYRVETMPDTFWLSPPDYATQTGIDGRFQLPFLREGLYRLLILTDANRNHRLDHGEQFALATSDVTVGDDIPPDSINLFPTVYDTVPFTLKSCASIGPRLISLNFSHPLDTTGASAWRISARDSATGLPQDLARLNPTPRRTSSVTIDGNWIAGTVYSFASENIGDQRGRQIVADSCQCRHVNVVDSVGPKIEWVFLPSVIEALKATDPIIWVFSEPVDSVRIAGAVSVRDTAGARIDGETAWRDAQTLTFTPGETWPDTVEVLAAIDSVHLVDEDGNLAGAGTYRWRFRPLGEGFLGAIEGQIESSPSSPPDYWIDVHEVGKSRSTRVRLTGPGKFSLTLPAGRWQLGGFVDTDRDGRWSPGRLDPFAPPELRAVPSDTLDVRARFTLEDIVLRF